MEVRDPIHGGIPIYDAEVPVLDSLFFQRLRQLKQLGFAELSFPGATHNRYLHSIGVMHVATRAFETVFKNKPFTSPQVRERFLQTLRLGALLHDIGHGPYSHSSEVAMPPVETLNLKFPGIHFQERQANHEDYTLKIILESELTDSFKEVTSQYGIHTIHIASLIAGHPGDPSFFIDGGIDYFPVLHQLVSSEIDADRMDYLIRDSYYCGVSYGSYDFEWLITNLDYALVENRAYLAINSRAIYSFDDFLLSRYHMFLMVYFHYKSVIFEEMLNRFFDECRSEFSIPSSLDDYLHCDDSMVFSWLRSSQNEWAKRIVNRKPFKLVYESHLNPKETPSQTADQVELEFKNRNIQTIRNHSTGALSKYYLPGADSKGFRIFVKDHSSESISPIEEVTDLFKKYSEKRSITRIYANPDSLRENPDLIKKYRKNG